MLKHLKEYGLVYLLAVLMYTPPIITSVYYLPKIKDLGSEFTCLDIGNQRRFYDKRNKHVYFDIKKDDTLDRTCISLPVSPMMSGGAGWAHFEIKTTDEDRKRFSLASKLFKEREEFK